MTNEEFRRAVELCEELKTMLEKQNDRMRREIAEAERQLETASD